MKGYYLSRFLAYITAKRLKYSKLSPFKKKEKRYLFKFKHLFLNISIQKIFWIFESTTQFEVWKSSEPPIVFPFVSLVPKKLPPGKNFPFSQIIPGGVDSRKFGTGRVEKVDARVAPPPLRCKTSCCLEVGWSGRCRLK